MRDTPTDTRRTSVVTACLNRPKWPPDVNPEGGDATRASKSLQEGQGSGPKSHDIGVPDQEERQARPARVRTFVASTRNEELEACLQQAGRLHEDSTGAVQPGAPGQCLQSFASLPRRSIQKADLADSLKAIDNVLLTVVDGTQRKPRLLSDLGKFLQAQPTLRDCVNRNRETKLHIARLFSLATSDLNLSSDASDVPRQAIDVAQLATAQVKIGYYSSDYWEKLERSGLGRLSARGFSNAVHAAAKLHAVFDAPLPSAALQQCMWDALQADGHRLAAKMNAQEVSNTWWALAKLKLTVPSDIQRALHAAVVRVSSKLVSQGVANIWYSYAELKLAVPADTRGALQSATVRLAPRMVPQAVANIWWSFATLGLATPLNMDEALQSATIQTSPRMSPQEVANSLWALGVQAVLPGVSDGAKPGKGQRGSVSLSSNADRTVASLISRLLKLYEEGATITDAVLDQVHSVSGILGLQRRLGPQGLPLLQECQAASLAQEAEQRPGERNRDGKGGAKAAIRGAVLDTLRSLPELAEYEVTPEVLVGDGSRRVSFRVEGHGVRIAVVLDGRSHFLTDSSGRVVRATGLTVLRNWQLHEWGYAVLRVPVMSKSPDHFRSAKHTAWLLRELRARGVAA